MCVGLPKGWSSLRGLVIMSKVVSLNLSLSLFFPACKGPLFVIICSSESSDCSPPADCSLPPFADPVYP